MNHVLTGVCIVMPSPWIDRNDLPMAVIPVIVIVIVIRGARL
jgi:hypothetical protein